MKKQILNQLGILFTLILTTAIISCDDSDDLIQDEVSGTYIGTLSSDLASKSSSSVLQKSATARISWVGDRIEVHCFGENFDETVMLNMYQHNDSIMVCLTGNDFENMYGHRLGQGNMMNGNMGDMSTSWMQHRNNEHQEGDEHFGGFNMKNHSFGYTFRMHDGDFHFQGRKE